MSEWVKWEPKHSGDIVPMRQWGVDHWSVLMCLEIQCVEVGGLIDKYYMRCDNRVHGKLCSNSKCSDETPTQLFGGTLRYKYDDWSCLQGMIAMGLFKGYVMDFGTGNLFKVEITSYGSRIASILRKYCTDEKKLSEFTLERDTRHIHINKLFTQDEFIQMVQDTEINVATWEFTLKLFRAVLQAFFGAIKNDVDVSESDIGMLFCDGVELKEVQAIVKLTKKLHRFFKTHKSDKW